MASKYPIIDTKTLNYSHWGLRNPRKALGCKLDVSSLYKNKATNANIYYVWMICTHLQNDATFDEQWYQSKALRQWTMQLANNAHALECRGIFIAGDFNLPGWSTPVQHLTTGGFIDTIVGPTYPSNRPKVQFDHLFVQEQSAFQLVNEQDGFVVHGSTASTMLLLWPHYVTGHIVAKTGKGGGKRKNNGTTEGGLKARSTSTSTRAQEHPLINK